VRGVRALPGTASLTIEDKANWLRLSSVAKKLFPEEELSSS